MVDEADTRSSSLYGNGRWRHTRPIESHSSWVCLQLGTRPTVGCTILSDHVEDIGADSLCGATNAHITECCGDLLDDLERVVADWPGLRSWCEL